MRLLALLVLLVPSAGLRALRGCPLCEDFGECLRACASHRSEGLHSRFCLERCGDSHPWKPIRTGFDGPEPPTAEEKAKTWYNDMVKLLNRKAGTAQRSAFIASFFRCTV